MEAKGALPPKLRALKEELERVRLADAAERTPAAASRKASVMEILLLGIYSFFVWLIFIKLKWLPWNTPRRSSS